MSCLALPAFATFGQSKISATTRQALGIQMVRDSERRNPEQTDLLKEDIGLAHTLNNFMPSPAHTEVQSMPAQQTDLVRKLCAQGPHG